MMTTAIEFILNGRPIQLPECATNLTLLEYLRGTGLTGSKEGCAEGDCGACSVVILDRDAEGKPAYRAINSCLVPVCLLDGREVVSVEGIGKPDCMHPVQEAMVKHLGSQCGYCTPGFVSSMFEGYYRTNVNTREKINEQLCGNLCRCTGYRPIVDAAVEAYANRQLKDDAFAVRLAQPMPSMRAVDFERNGEKFLRPTTLAHLLQLRTELPQAKLIAGATEVGLEITKRYKRLPVVISVEGVEELRQITSTATHWRIGGTATLSQIEDKLGEEFPSLGDMLRVFGSRQIRNRATMGGNIVTASPIGDSAPVLLSLEASVVLASTRGERTLPIEEFFLSYRKTALQPDEILAAILIPRGGPALGHTRRAAWFKVSKRREMDISTVAGSFVMDLDAANVIQHVRLGFGGVAATPARALATEKALLGQSWTEATLRSALSILANEFTPITDVRGSAEYRRALIPALLERFFANPQPTDAMPPCSARPPAAPHESAHLHVTGTAEYTDDKAADQRSLEVWPVCAPHARAKIVRRDASAAHGMPGIHAVLLAEDVPGVNDVGAMHKDEILLANKEISFHGQIVALVVGETQELCRAAAAKVVVEYEPLPPILTTRDALAAGSFHNEPNYIRRGDCQQALAAAPQTLEGEFELNGQEHFYLEMQAAWAQPGEDQTIHITSSTQHPTEVQNLVAHVLHIPVAKVVVQVPRMGGGFGGKETQAAGPAAMAALGAVKTGKAVRVHYNRDQDMALTGHRHPFLARFKVGFDNEGRLLAAQVALLSNGGWARDLSQAVTDRALFHLDNSYYIPAVEFSGQVARTNLSSNTAFRGFGGPQGMLVIEEIMDRIARQTGLPPEVVRERNLYHGSGETNTTHYGQAIGDNRIQTVWHELMQTSQFAQRRAEISEWNAHNSRIKRGLAITPVKFGISFTVTHLNQAGAFVVIYLDGTVQVNHGGTEMGQGLQTNMRSIASRVLGAKLKDIRVMPTSTDKVPNTSATAASVGTDINGAAVKNACEILRERLRPVAAKLYRDKFKIEIDAAQLLFADDKVFVDGHTERLSFGEVVRHAWQERISLSTTGFYATPGITWDRAAGRGKPFHYFSYGAAVSEVEVDGYTGMHQLKRVDILHDVGNAINEGISLGQVEGGFAQGMGWLTAEELLWDKEGRLLTHCPDTYKIPAIGDMPPAFHVSLLRNAEQPDVVYGSKAVGEPPFMLAISVREAIRDAVAAFGPAGGQTALAAPATGEAIWRAIQGRQAHV